MVPRVGPGGRRSDQRRDRGNRHARRQRTDPGPAARRSHQGIGETQHERTSPIRTSIRILFIFDPARNAVLLVAGDKAGSWKGWYDKNIPVAEHRYNTWLAEQHGGE